MKHILSIFFIFSVFITGGYWSAHSDEGSVIYFYNPETNINNFATLKTAFDTYLVNHGGYYFQPFDLRENFESVIKEKKGDVFLLSSWHLKALQQKNIPLKIALVGTSKGNTMQRKVLSTKKDITDVAMLKNTVVAGAGSEEYIHSVLKQILGKEQEALLKDIKILLVPKDIDAIMAVGFGMATAAISAESSLDKLAMINPNQFRELHGLGFSEKDYLLVAATLKKPEQQEAQLLEVLRKMSEADAGEENLKLLGIDGWRAMQ
ncbi:PhnD/SsuA/transferrin family substrate-binding protein [Methylobacter sp.]|uniref:PhnD/SsuA/transferrin family substrate-binding protein n=1 Tax=Methylobacter sp. TaxID=2051955 RepID=UPI002FDCD106